MKSESISREIALLVLGQISESEKKIFDLISLDALLNKAFQSLMDHWREGLDSCARKLEEAQQHLLDSELEDFDRSSLGRVRKHLASSLSDAEFLLNGLSMSLDMPRLLALSDQVEIRKGAINRVKLVLDKKSVIDIRLDSVMEGWRLKRLPRIDRDILRLAVIDLIDLNIPLPVACNEAVELANKYSDEQGRKMINGILRRFQNSFNITVA